MRRTLALRMGYPIRVLSRLMTYAELIDWCRVFAREPFDDQRCYDRPAAAIQASMWALKAPKAELTLTDFLPFREAESDEPESIDQRIMRYL